MTRRVQNLRKLFKGEKIEALLITEPANIRYLTGFYGLTPKEREGYVLVTKTQVYLMTDGRYIVKKHTRSRRSPSPGVESTKDTSEVARKTSQGNTSDGDPPNRRGLLRGGGIGKQGSSEVEVLEIKPKSDIAKLLTTLVTKLKIRRLGFEANDLTFKEYKTLKTKSTDNKGGDRRVNCPQLTLVPTKDLVENLRSIKEKGEIKKIKKAANLADKCFEYLLKFIKPGLTENQIAWEIEKFIKENGAKLSFPPIVASGPNSSIPHHTTSKNYKLKPKSLLLIDFGAKINGYCSDMTRVVFLGKATNEQRKIYNIVLAAQKKAFKALTFHFDTIKYRGEDKRRGNKRRNKETMMARKVDEMARKFLKSQGFSLPHGLGHGVGLCEHEKPTLGPKSRDALRPGMIFTIEPGIYLPGKFGVRLEDLVLLKEGKLKILTKSPK